MLWCWEDRLGSRDYLHVRSVWGLSIPPPHPPLSLCHFTRCFCWILERHQGLYLTCGCSSSTPPFSALPPASSTNELWLCVCTCVHVCMCVLPCLCVTVSYFFEQLIRITITGMQLESSPFPVALPESGGELSHVSERAHATLFIQMCQMRRRAQCAQLIWGPLFWLAKQLDTDLDNRFLHQCTWSNPVVEHFLLSLY